MQCREAWRSIDVKQIGEPVSAVKLDKFSWYDATERAPALCVVEGAVVAG